MIDVHTVDDGYVLSEGDTWRPGCFESVEAATAGAKLSDERLHSLQQQAGRGVITLRSVIEPEA